MIIAAYSGEEQESEEIERTWLEHGKPGIVVAEAVSTPSFLPRLAGLKQLALDGPIRGGNDDVVSECQSLEYLLLASGCKNAIDLRALRELRRLEISGPRAGSEHLPDKLEAISYFGCPWRTLDPLSTTRSLRSVNIDGRRVADISALSACTDLRRMRLNYLQVENPFLEAELHKLERLALEASRVVRSLEGISENAQALKFLELSDIPRLNSLAPLAGNRSLSLLSLTGSTRVADDDLSPLLCIPRLKARVRPFRSYKPRVEELGLEPEVGEFDFSVFGERL